MLSCDEYELYLVGKAADFLVSEVSKSLYEQLAEKD